MVYPAATLAQSPRQAQRAQLERTCDGTWVMIEAATLEGSADAIFNAPSTQSSGIRDRRYPRGGISEAGTTMLTSIRVHEGRKWSS
jgi:hypothetical protein